MILENIKKSTAENHKRLEQSQLLRPVTSADLTHRHYFRILKAFYGFFHPLENAISHCHAIREILPDFEERRKACMIAADLLHLKAVDSSDKLALCSSIPEVSTAQQAFGCLYVMEGSTLGGRVIARNLKQHLNLDAGHGASFFSGYGEDTGKKWKIFQQALVHFSNQYGKDAEVIEAANDTFHKLQIWVSQN